MALTIRNLEKLTDNSDPRKTLESLEEVIAPTHAEELGQSFGRVLAWLTSSIEVNAVGFKSLVMVYRLRPDLLNGASLDAISSQLGYGRTAAHRHSKEFRQMFGLPSLHDREDTKVFAQSWARRNPDAQRQDGGSMHLRIINRFCAWLSENGIDGMDDERLARIKRDFAPLLAFLRELESE